MSRQDKIESAGRLAEFAAKAMSGTPSQAAAARDAAYCSVYLGQPHTQYGDMAAAADVVSELLAEVAKLQKFKDYVHKRLDDAGVPTDPDGPHKAEGCRIGGRLDIVLADRRADDAEAWTDDWMLAVGFKGYRPKHTDRRRKKPHPLHFVAIGNESALWVEIAPDGRVEVMGDNPSVLEEFFYRSDFGAGYLCRVGATRGDVRRLCAALGIKLTEGGAS